MLAHAHNLTGGWHVLKTPSKRQRATLASGKYDILDFTAKAMAERAVVDAVRTDDDVSNEQSSNKKM